MKKEIIIEGMACSHCSSRVEKALNGIPGIKAEVVLEKKTAYIELSEEISDETLTQIIEDAGYKAAEIK